MRGTPLLAPRRSCPWNSMHSTARRFSSTPRLAFPKLLLGLPAAARGGRSPTGETSAPAGNAARRVRTHELARSRSREGLCGSTAPDRFATGRAGAPVLIEASKSPCASDGLRAWPLEATAGASTLRPMPMSSSPFVVQHLARPGTHCFGVRGGDGKREGPARKHPPMSAARAPHRGVRPNERRPCGRAGPATVAVCDEQEEPFDDEDDDGRCD